MENEQLNALSIMTFDRWYGELTSDEIWFNPASMHHRAETFKKVAQRVYMGCVADGVFKPMPECRKHVYNILANTPGDKPKQKTWVDAALEKQAEEENKEWKPASPEHVDKCVAEFDEMMKNAPMNNAFPRIGYKQAVEEGGWLPAKKGTYPATSRDELYVKERRFQYIKANYEPRTGKPLPDFIDEEEYNKLYDEGLL